MDRTKVKESPVILPRIPVTRSETIGSPGCIPPKEGDEGKCSGQCGRTPEQYIEYCFIVSEKNYTGEDASVIPELKELFQIKYRNCILKCEELSKLRKEIEKALSDPVTYLAELRLETSKT